jgi:hypothetical protein
MQRNDVWMFPAIAIAGVTMACAVGIRTFTGFSGQPNGTTGLKMAIAAVTVAALWRFLRHLFGLWRAGVTNPIGRIKANLRIALADFAPIAIGVAVISTFLYWITFLKSMIVAVVPFWADEPLAMIDRWLFIDPQQIALALLPSVPAISLFYGMWHAVHLGGILWVLHWRDLRKAHFIISFMLTWTIGMALAYIFSSAGPIFTGRYDPSLAPEAVRRIVDFLWTNYKNSGAQLGGGISAFPSMHVALAVWFALVLQARRATWLGVAYVIGIFAGSIILGWHYAMDSVAGIAVALLAHRIAGQWLARREGYTSATVAAGAVPN